MSKNTAPVDFTNPEALAAELAAAEAPKQEAAAGKKEKKPAKPKVIKVSFTADKDIKAGETVTFDYEVPKSESGRGIVAGIPVEEMTEDQLKIEYRNANSVYYKTKKAGKDVTKSEARLNAVKAAMEAMGIQPTSRASADVDATAVAALIKSGKISIDELEKLLNA